MGVLKSAVCPVLRIIRLVPVRIVTVDTLTIIWIRNSTGPSKRIEESGGVPQFLVLGPHHVAECVIGGLSLGAVRKGGDDQSVGLVVLIEGVLVAGSRGVLPGLRQPVPVGVIGISGCGRFRFVGRNRLACQVPTGVIAVIRLDTRSEE